MFQRSHQEKPVLFHTTPEWKGNVGKALPTWCPAVSDSTNIAVSREIKAMFHQIHLQPTDTPVLMYIWRDLQREEQPIIYK